MIHAPFRYIFYGSALATIGVIELLARVAHPWFAYGYLLFFPAFILGLMDILQRKQAIRRNYPLLGRMRYLFEAIRPEINQYFIESDIDGRPFNREMRANIYQRAKRQLNTRPYGTKLDVYKDGYEWINHSMTPVDHHLSDLPRITIGGPDCKQPYSASLFNISAMSFGSLSKNAVLALNEGAKIGNFYHNTGEGGLSPYHLEPGGDVVWQIGTGYFGCRTHDGNFNPETFEQRANLPNVKMIELKLSQGAKPGHGGILPKQKITPEIAAIRDVPMDQDVLSPPYHKAFNTPKGMLAFIQQLRDLSNGKPVGIKLCLGNDYEFLAMCKAMLETGIKPDYIVVDGSEGGTGAAPLEFSDSIGMPLTDALVFVHNALVACGLRDDIKVCANGKVTTAFNIVRQIALGADFCGSARGMMFALGCIQALQCHSNKCPTGVATQDPYLVEGLVVEHKSKRVAQYHERTMEHVMEILGAAGLHDTDELNPNHIYRRLNQEKVRRLGEIYNYLSPNCLINGEAPETWQNAWNAASAESFQPCVNLVGCSPTAS